MDQTDSPSACINPVETPSISERVTMEETQAAETWSECGFCWLQLARSEGAERREANLRAALEIYE
jgi:hypothetical protein